MKRSLAALAAANPVSAQTARVAVPQQWTDELFRRAAAEPPPERGGSTPRQRRRRLVLVATAALILLTAPSYAVAREVLEWMRGEPAPPSVVREFESYATQLGYRPDADGAILVAADEGDVRLYSTANDKGSYCLVLRAPGRPSGDGGTCIPPAWAEQPLIAGVLGSGRAGEGVRVFVGGRSDDRAARSVRFTDPAGRTLTRATGFDGFFVAAVDVPEPCSGGDWRPTFVVLDDAGNEIARAAITIWFDGPLAGTCGAIPPHPPFVR